MVSTCKLTFLKITVRAKQKRLQTLGSMFHPNKGGTIFDGKNILTISQSLCRLILLKIDDHQYSLHTMQIAEIISAYLYFRQHSLLILNRKFAHIFEIILMRL